jgi:hypothetical protein
MNSRNTQESRSESNPTLCPTSDSITESEVRKIKTDYFIIYSLCRRSSSSFGLYLLFFLFFGFLYFITTLYGVYLKQYPSRGIVGFALVGLFIVLGLAAAITACNETGNNIHGIMCYCCCYCFTATAVTATDAASAQAVLYE